MRFALILAAPCFVLSAQVLASPAPAPHMPAQKAFASAPKDPAQACMAGSSLLSHTAYSPSAAEPLRCSELLSTDTLMKVRRWDRT